MPTTMCDLAKTLPLLIGRLLDREVNLKRGRFREETMTDIFTGALAAFAGPELIIQYPVESETGGDLDIQFWHVKSDRQLNLRIQAKRLSASLNGSRKINIEHRSYRKLLHKTTCSTDFQFQILTKSPFHWLPLYMFYNHQSVVDNPYFAGDEPMVSGVNLAFATDIAGELKLKLDAAKAKPRSVKHHKRLSHLRKHLFGLEAILCPPGDWEGAGVPTPDAVSASLHDCWTARVDETLQRKHGDDVLRILSEPSELRPDSRRTPNVPDGPSIRIDHTLTRPMVTFISGRTDDDRTPRITDEFESRQR